MNENLELREKLKLLVALLKGLDGLELTSLEELLGSDADLSALRPELRSLLLDVSDAELQRLKTLYELCSSCSLLSPA